MFIGNLENETVKINEEGHGKKARSSVSLNRRLSLPDSYKVPKFSHRRVKLGQAIKEKKLDYITLIAETSKRDIDFTKVFANRQVNTPGPNKYSQIRDWSDVRKGTIAKQKKVTYIDEIFLNQKKNKSPGPNTY